MFRNQQFGFWSGIKLFKSEVEKSLYYCYNCALYCDLQATLPGSAGTSWRQRLEPPAATRGTSWWPWNWQGPGTCGHGCGGWNRQVRSTAPPWADDALGLWRTSNSSLSCLSDRLLWPVTVEHGTYCLHCTNTGTCGRGCGGWNRRVRSQYHLELTTHQGI